MSEAAEIILWTLSLLLAVAGIVFGVIASINSRNALIHVQELVSNSLIADEASKYFFSNLREINITNRHILNKLRKEKDKITFHSYGLSSIGTRLVPIPQRTFKALNKSEFENLVAHYKIVKKNLDKDFLHAVDGDFSLLSQDIIIDKPKLDELFEYHRRLGVNVRLLLKEYTTLVETPTHLIDGMSKGKK